MKLYLVSRWGNPHDESGPDAEDTNLLVAASSHSEASVVSDSVFRSLPHKSDCGGRDVQQFSNSVIELGDARIDSTAPSVLHGPWISNATVQHIDMSQIWYRDSLEDDWLLLEAKAEQNRST